jgi:hypothetical protein
MLLCDSTRPQQWCLSARAHIAIILDVKYLCFDRASIVLFVGNGEVVGFQLDNKSGLWDGFWNRDSSPGRVDMHPLAPVEILTKSHGFERILQLVEQGSLIDFGA